VALFLAVVGAASLIVLVALAVGLARRLGELARSMTALQKELVPALEEIQTISEETRKLTARLEERARVLRPDGD
jgi:hypothetical protein